MWTDRTASYGLLIALTLASLGLIGCGEPPLAPTPPPTQHLVPDRVPVDLNAPVHFDGVPLCQRDPAFCA